jgi:hypothetical protein
MIRDADTAMYHAKMSGKARAALFDPTMHTQVMEQLQLESDLRWAVERGELRVHYQPIVALDSGTIVGMEALVRWQHPQRGLLFPPEFLTIAEETGLIVPVSWWVLRAACYQLGAWQRQLPGASALWVSVNLSARQLAQPDIVTCIRRILAETGLTPAHLKLEITEYTLIAFGDATYQVLAELRALGVQCSSASTILVRGTRRSATCSASRWMCSRSTAPSSARSERAASAVRSSRLSLGSRATSICRRWPKAPRPPSRRSSYAAWNARSGRDGCSPKPSMPRA